MMTKSSPIFPARVAMIIALLWQNSHHSSLPLWCTVFSGRKDELPEHAETTLAESRFEWLISHHPALVVMIVIPPSGTDFITHHTPRGMSF